MTFGIVSPYRAPNATRPGALPPNPGQLPNNDRLVITTGGNGDFQGNDGFRNMQVDCVPPVVPVHNDHQGHIVAQRLIVNEMGLGNAQNITAANQGNFAGYLAPNPNAIVLNANVLNEITAVGAALDAVHVGAGFADLAAYINHFAAELRVATQLDQTTKLDVAQYFLEFVLWNTVNICRAPSDNTRNGVPGHTIDTAVAQKIHNDLAPAILAAQQAAPVPIPPALATQYLNPHVVAAVPLLVQAVLVDALAAAAINLAALNNPANWITFFAACNAPLQQATWDQAFGYYRFNWTNQAVAPALDLHPQ